MLAEGLDWLRAREHPMVNVKSSAHVKESGKRENRGRGVDGPAEK